jgi:GT2 family glycosyltransferase
LAAPSVAIVILNWNGKDFLQRFLPSVVAASYPNTTVVIADNASKDGSPEFVEENFPGVRIIRLPVNYGFAKGYNEALKQVEADYFVLLNSDVEVTGGWLDPLISHLENNPRAAACQPKILAYKHRDSFEYAGAAGGWLDLYGYPFARGRIFDFCENDEGQYDETREVFWASGAAMAVRASVFQELNGFDPYLFAHQEEIDLCWRMHLAGHQVFCCPASVVYHVGGGTLPKGNSRKTYLNFRNNQIILAKNLPLSEKFWKIPWRIFLDQVSALRGLMKGDMGYFIAIFRAHLGFLTWVFFVKKQKRKFKRRKLKSIPGVYHGNVVWQHFAKGKKKFSDLVR